MKNSPVSFQRKSSNSKLSHVIQKPQPNGRFQTFPQPPFVCSTYASIEKTCPKTCRFLCNGCYAQCGQAANVIQSLDYAAASYTGTEVNKLEAALIDKQWPKGIPQDGRRGGRDLRLHTGGDFASAAGARALAFAAVRWLERGGGTVWAYTHRWKAIGIENFGPIIIRASVETLDEAEDAIRRGFTPAITLRYFERAQRYKLLDKPIWIIPCPAQTRDRKCIECRLCLKPLQYRVAIGLKVHGMGASKAARRLPRLGQERFAFYND